MGFKLYDFYCHDCEREFEELVETRDDIKCPKCGSPCSITTSVPKLGSYSMMDSSQRTAHLKERSRKHSMKEIKKNAEKFGELGKQMARKA